MAIELSLMTFLITMECQARCIYPCSFLLKVSACLANLQRPYGGRAPRESAEARAEISFALSNLDGSTNNLVIRSEAPGFSLDLWRPPHVLLGPRGRSALEI